MTSVNMADEEAKPAVNDAQINIIVAAQDGSQVHFKVKRTTPFQKVFNAYAIRQTMDCSQLKFLFDGRRLRATDTPADFDMEDGDTLDCMLEQVGGSC